MAFFNNLIASLSSPQFYQSTDSMPLAEAWKYFIKLNILAAFILSLIWGFKFNGFYNEGLDFFKNEIDTVEIVNGRISNMPLSHKILVFRGWTIHVDTLYTSLNSVFADSSAMAEANIFVGPEAVYIGDQARTIPIDIPKDMSMTLDYEKLAGYKFKTIILIWILSLIGTFLVLGVSSLLMLFLIITPIFLFKFRRHKPPYQHGLKAGLFLSTFYLVAATLLIALGLLKIWIYLLFVLFYIIYIGAAVNIEVVRSKIITETESER
jgi:hypothetical protein